LACKRTTVCVNPEWAETAVFGIGEESAGRIGNGTHRQEFEVLVAKKDSRWGEGTAFCRQWRMGNSGKSEFRGTELGKEANCRIRAAVGGVAHWPSGHPAGHHKQLIAFHWAIRANVLSSETGTAQSLQILPVDTDR
jgi:hypothetical protein